MTAGAPLGRDALTDDGPITGPVRPRIEHRLSPLLTPRSVAVVGASPREGSAGATIVDALSARRFDGPVYAVNPRYDEIDGKTCYRSLADLPEAPDLAVLAVADGRLEEALSQAIEAGVGAVSMFGSCVLPETVRPPLAQRLSAMAKAADMPVNGANCLGYCNYEAGIFINPFPFADRDLGAITFLAQSGSVFGAIANANPRLGLNLAVSTGRELSTSVADYMDYALALESTKVIGLFLETVRDPGAFVDALERAEAQGVPVVALKTGRSATAARMAESHSGALAGNDSAYDALFQRYGVSRVDTLDELVATMLLLERAGSLGPGGLATIHDSGGERELIVDAAEEIGVPFARIGAATRARLEERLDFGLEPENPLDAFGTSNDYDGIMRDCFAALMADDETALGLFVLDANQDNAYSMACVNACIEAAATTAKPVALATNYGAGDHRELAARLTRDGIPFLDGTMPALKAVAHGFARRAWLSRDRAGPSSSDPKRREAWRARLAHGPALDEAEACDLLVDYGLNVIQHRVVESRNEALAAADALAYPVALKTAVRGIAHKTDVGGVHLDLSDQAAVGEAWNDLAARLGPRVLVAPMAPSGVDMVLGVVVDPQFGPLVVIGAGGILVELYRDSAALIAPAPRQEVDHVLATLTVSKLLDGVRGQGPFDRQAVVDAAVALSHLAADLGDVIGEIDVNPLRVMRSGAVALDALVITHKQ